MDPNRRNVKPRNLILNSGKEMQFVSGERTDVREYQRGMWNTPRTNLFVNVL